MLHKMYLVPVEQCHHTHTKRERHPSRRRTKQHHHTEWIKLRTKHRVAELWRNARTKEIANYSKQILPAATNPQTPDLELPNIKAKSRRGTQTDVTSASVTDIRPSKEIIYETQKSGPVREDDDHHHHDDGFLEENAKRFGRENVGSEASPYLMPYVYKRRFLDTQYGIRKDGDKFKIGNSPVLVDQDGDITIKENEFRGSEGLWNLLTRMNMNKEHVTADELTKYKKILLLTNAHLEGYDPACAINVGRGKKFRESIDPTFARPNSMGVGSGLRRAWKNNKLTAIYYNP